MSSYASEMELGEFGEMEGEEEYGEFEGEMGGPANPLSEAQEVELASELLEVNSEAELEQFLGSLISKVGRAAGGFLKSPVGQALGGILKGIAKKALPVVGGALGSMVAPGIGTALGSKLGSMAGGLFELELESMPQEQAEFEVARRLVGLSATAAHHAAQVPPKPGADPYSLARAAVIEAARDYAPGLHRQMAQRSGTASGRNGYGREAQRVPGRGIAGPRRAPFRPGGRVAAHGPARRYGGDSWDFPVDEPQGDGWGFDGDDSSAMGGAGTPRSMTGRWVRRGRRIVLLGI